MRIFEDNRQKGRKKEILTCIVVAGIGVDDEDSDVDDAVGVTEDDGVETVTALAAVEAAKADDGVVGLDWDGEPEVDVVT